MVGGQDEKEKKTKQKMQWKKRWKMEKYGLISQKESLKTVIKVKMRDRSGEKKNYKFHTMKVVDVVVVVVSLFQFFTFF